MVKQHGLLPLEGIILVHTVVQLIGIVSLVVSMLSIAVVSQYEYYGHDEFLDSISSDQSFIDRAERTGRTMSELLINVMLNLRIISISGLILAGVSLWI